MTNFKISFFILISILVTSLELPVAYASAHRNSTIFHINLPNPSKSDELTHLDAILLSHFHDDHFDKIVQEIIDRNITIITNQEAAKKLKQIGFKDLYGLEKWQSVVLQKGDSILEITSLPGKHGPGIIASLLPTVQGTLLEFKKLSGEITYRIYISGDTFFYKELVEIPEHYPAIDLGLFHLGGTRVMGLTLTMDAEQGTKALKIIAPNHAIPIHYNDYDRFNSSLDMFKKSVEKAGLKTKMHYLKHGETYHFQSHTN